MKRLVMILIFCGSGLAALSAQAQNSPHLGCRVHPKDIPVVGTRAVLAAVEDKESLPDSMNVQADMDAELSSANSLGQGTFEGYYRPREDGFYSVLPIPIFGFELSRDRNLIYVCAHGDTDSKKNHFTIYLMRGFHLDPLHYGTIIGDLLSKPKLEVKPLSPVLVPLGSLQSQFKGVGQLIFLPFQLFAWQLTAVTVVQRLFSNVIGDISGMAIERIIITEDTLEVASGIDLEHPEKARWKKSFDLKVLQDSAAPRSSTASPSSSSFLFNTN